MPTIMVIDDDAAVRRGLEIRLRAAGFTVLSSGYADDAINRVLRDRPDLILLDFDLPGFSGLELHECLRVTERGKNIPVVYLSGTGTPPYREEAFRTGARAFVSKPYDPDELVATLRGVLASSKPQAVASSN